MTTLPDFNDDAREALLDKAESVMDGAGDTLKDSAEENFKDYASQRGYDIGHIWRDAVGPTTKRSRSSVTTRVEWPALTTLFEFGVEPHVISGSPLLAFYWPGPPEGTRPPGAPANVVAQKVNWGSVTGGIDESRAIRGALNYTRFRLQEGEISL